MRMSTGDLDRRGNSSCALYLVRPNPGGGGSNGSIIEVSRPGRHRHLRAFAGPGQAPSGSLRQARAVMLMCALSIGAH